MVRRHSRRPRPGTTTRRADGSCVDYRPEAATLRTRHLGQVDQGEASLRVKALRQFRPYFAEHHLERRPYLGVLEVAADRGAVGPAEDDVDVRDSLALRRGEVPEE